jgi:conjugal transfer pilus assembly protein TraK
MNKRLMSLSIASLLMISGHSFAEESQGALPYKNSLPAPVVPAAEPVKQVSASPQVAKHVSASPQISTQALTVGLNAANGGTLLPIPPKPPALAVPLPGVGIFPGAVPMNNTIRVRENSSETASISFRYINRIATPFAKPKLLESAGWEISKNGSSVFVKPTTPEPTVLYITGDSPNDPTISIVLVPQEIPPQTLTLQLDKGYGNGGTDKDAGDVNKAASYSERIQIVMKSIALGKTVSGYSESPLPKSVARSDNLIFTPDKRYSGKSDDIYVYWIENATNAPLEMDESMFYEDGIRAIAFFPETLLQPGKGTRLFVMSENGKGDK